MHDVTARGRGWTAMELHECSKVLTPAEIQALAKEVVYTYAWPMYYGDRIAENVYRDMSSLLLTLAAEQAKQGSGDGRL